MIEAVAFMFGIIGLSMGSMGFISGVNASSQVGELKKELQQLRARLEGK